MQVALAATESIESQNAKSSNLSGGLLTEAPAGATIFDTA
jgi:hypothetical protein